MKRIPRLIVMAALGLMVVGAVAAQAPPGPITPPPLAPGDPGPAPRRTVQIQPRKNIFGAWRLNRDESDDPRQSSNRRKVNDSGSRSGGYGGPRVGVGLPGGPGIGTGRPSGGSQKDTQEDQQRYAELIDPSVRLRLDRKGEKDPLVEMYGDQGRKTIFYTDGKKPDTPAGVGTDILEAKWDGDKLVSESTLPKKGSLKRTYEVSTDGMQLWEEVEMVVGKDKNPSRFRFVYDAVAEEQ